MRIRPQSILGAAGLALLATGIGVLAYQRSDGLRAASPGAVPRQRAPACLPDNGGLTLPPGTCALIVAEEPGARHIAVTADGTIYIAVGRSARGPGGVVALRDEDGDGKAEIERRFGPSGGSGLVLHGGYLYFAPDDAVLRWRLPAGTLVPEGAPDTLVEGLPTGGDHHTKSIAVDDQGNLYVDVGSASNACQRANRMLESPGVDPCTELERRAGIWRFRGDRLHQQQADGTRYATGIRNAVALTLDRRGRLWAAQHGRDQLFQNWPKLFDARAGAELPAEEVLLVHQGDDFGWPYCYYDQLKHHLVLAPEYGGDGVTVGRCNGKKEPVYAFPGHWAPDGVLHVERTPFPGFGEGLFIAFHGSWNRAPEPQAGYNVVFLPLTGEKPGNPVTFADGFGGPGLANGNARYRPTGVTQGPDGSLYVTSDAGGRIWRVLPSAH